MKYFFIFLFFLSLNSCEDFKVKKISAETILNEELETFNWSDVDEYPSFSACDSSLTKEEKKQCFQSVLTSHITNHLEKEMIVVTQDIRDTTLLEFEVTKAGELKLLYAKIDTLTLEEIPNIKSFLSESMASLPKVYPAIKRGQQVTTSFNLPLIILVK